jgi:DNA-directed RNA polymerase specialized sigma24 family protein
MAASLHIPLANPALRERLLAYARKRGPAAYAEDLVQDTLVQAVENPPPASVVETDDSMIRWLSTVVRNKIIDLHRRNRLTLRLVHETDTARTHDPIGALEARSELAQIPADHSQPVRWIAREAEGETLAQIAKEEALPATVVRKRVSRFRQHVRNTLLVAAVTLLTAFVWHPRNAGIAPDSLASVTAITMADLEGDYTVERVDTESELARSVVNGAHINVSKGTISIVGPKPMTLAIAAQDFGRVLVGGGTSAVSAAVRSDGRRVYLESWSGSFQGRLVLRRTAAP